jgi:5-bromo-4-chloroindolyl phosphate hydrolysis protein
VFAVRDLVLVLGGLAVGFLTSLLIVPMHPQVVLLVIVTGVAGAFAIGFEIGRATAKTQSIPMRGRVFEEPAALALVEIALKRQGVVR